ncbi:MAG TPA: type IV pilus secretin PilQ [Vicinamibacterales bacterium]|nr:type IV pilus secretin PilQ [Vicinamibacterales bacterium]
MMLGRIAPLVTVAACVAALAGHVATVDATASGAEFPRLRAVSARDDGGVSAVVIEATEPVAYVTSQPDPLTVLIDLRNVTAGGIQAGTMGRGLAPLRAVRVEESTAADGTPLARVRVALDRAAAHRVRTSRNLIVVELDRQPAAAATSTPGASDASMRAGATELSAVRASRSGDEVTVAIVGNGPLTATAVEEAKDLPPRVLLDFEGVAASRAVPAVIGVNQADVTRVRVAANSRTPLVTRVVVDLKRKTAYRLEAAGAAGEEVRVIFAAPAEEPATAAPVAEPIAVGPAPAAPAATAVPPTSVPVAVVPPPVPAPVAAQAQSSMGQDQGADGAKPKFTGHPVSLDFQGADLRAVLRTFSEISGLNVVIDPTINGTVDVSLRDVPWDQALDIILRANKLGYFVEGTIVRIAPLTVLAEEEGQRRKLTDEQALAGELQVMTRALSYAKGGDLVPILTRSALSTRGEVQVDPRTNTVIIRDLPDRLAAADALLTALDLPQPQVEIEARIVQTTRDFARNIGVQWGVSGRVSPDLGNTTGLAFPNNGSITGRTGAVQGPDGVANGVNLGVANASSALGLALGSINSALNLDVALSALERSGQGRLLSTPRVSTQNNVEAEITQGVQIPIQTIANNTVTVTFKDAALTLKVTPQITASNTVIMRVNLENAAPDYSRAINDIPPIDTQRAVTTVLVADGETTVIGGIYLSREQSVQGRTPLLSRVPLLGWLFKRDESSDESRELLIFLTPRITKG